jgi:hypothetical protein
VWLVPSACFWLAISWLALDVLPWRLYRYLLHPRQCGARESANSLLVRQVCQALNLASRCVPWSTVCFHKGIAAQQMLRRRGAPAVLHYGVAPFPESSLRAHVWVSCDGAVVVGGNGSEAVFTELAAYGSDDRGLAAPGSARYGR